MSSNCTVEQTYNALVTDKARQGGFTYSLTAQISQFGVASDQGKWTSAISKLPIISKQFDPKNKYSAYKG